MHTQLKRPVPLEKLQSILKERKLSYDLLAYNLNTSSGRICRNIKGFSKFNDNEKQKLAKILEVKMTELFG
jgi:ribosome-binding protein aMBF1 (putative translation factor)